MLALMVHASTSTTSVTKQLLINHSMILMEAGRLENLKIGALVHHATLQLSVHSTIKESLAVTMPLVLARAAIHLTSICLTVIQVRLLLLGVLLKIDAPVPLAQLMRPAQVTNVTMHLASPLSRLHLLATLHTLTKFLMKIP
jgi:hypothetical protein